MATTFRNDDDDWCVETDALPLPAATVASVAPANDADEQPRPPPKRQVIEDGVVDDDSTTEKTARDIASDFYYTTEVGDDSIKKRAGPDGDVVAQHQLHAGDFRVQDSAVEIENSTVHFGHNVKHRTDVNVKSAASVVVDRRQWNYITYAESKQSGPQGSTVTPAPASTSASGPVPAAAAAAAAVPAPAPQPIIEIVQEFNRNRYLHRLAPITPLPWCARFSPHLDHIYTNVQLVSSDRFDGRPSHVSFPLEQIFEDKHDETGASTSQTEGSSQIPCRPCRVLIEGNPGYGKTTLTLRMALDWAARKTYMNKFHLVFLIQLRHFKGDLQSYIFEELFPRHEDKARDDWWLHIKENQEHILFILDGLDEMPREHRLSIDQLLKGNLLDRASLVVTSRLVSSDDNVLSCFNRRILIQGFSEDQTEQFIHNYFQVINEPHQGSKLKTLLNGARWCGRHLTSCPLTCLLLCIVFKDEGDRIFNKVTEVYRDMVAWLIRRASASRDSVVAATTADFERALRDFGYLCIQALANGRVNFTTEQLQELPGNSGPLVLQLGLLVQSHTLGMTMRSPKNLCYQPIHKTFLEYLAAYYLSGAQVEENLMANLDPLQSEHLTRESLHLTFKFLAGLMGEGAATLFRFRYLSHFDLSMINLFELLHEAGATPDNVRAISSILDDEFVLVQSNRTELDAWARLLAEPDCPIRCLKFLWVSSQSTSAEGVEAPPNLQPLDFNALDRFFTAFQTNTSVVCLTINAAMGLSPNEKEAGAIAAFTAQALKKSKLRHLNLHLVGDTWSATVISAVNRALNYRIAAPSLVSLNINVDLGSSQVATFCQGLRQSSNIKSLVLPKLSCGPDGYVHIASLLKSIQHLSVSLNLMKALPPSSQNPLKDGSPQDLESLASFFSQTAQQLAGISVNDDADAGHPTAGEKSHQRSSNGSAVAILQANGVGRFNLHDGLRLSGCVAPHALGVMGLNVPGCRSDGGHGSGFHHLFEALKDPECQLVRLDLTGCCLGPDDFYCLGEALRATSSLKALRFAKLKSFDEVLPIIINTQLTWLDLSSGFITLNDISIIHLIRAISSASQLVTLSLAGWKFVVKSADVIREFREYTRSSRLQELSLANCRVQVKLIHKSSLPSASTNGGLSSLHNVSTSAPSKSDRLARFFRSMSMSSLSSQSSSSSSSSTSSSSPSPAAPFLAEDRPRPRCDLKSFITSTTSLDSCFSDWGSQNPVDDSSWPHLTKLSLATMVFSYQMVASKKEYHITGPKLLTYVDGLKNLSELSVSVKPTASTGAAAGFLNEAITELDDDQTRRFFSSLRRKLGRSLTHLRMSCCSLTWHRPSQTAFHVTRHLQKCERLVSVDLNFVRFRAVSAEEAGEELSHGLLDAIVCGVPHLEELNLIGVELAPLQASSLALKIRDRWKGLFLHIHTRRVADDVVLNLIHSLKVHPKFHVEFVGGYRATVMVRRRSHLCGLFRYLLTSASSNSSDAEDDDDGVEVSDIDEDKLKELLCSTLPPGHRNLFGLTPFDFSIMHAHLWNNKA